MRSTDRIDALGCARDQIKTLKTLLAGGVVVAGLGMYLVHQIPVHMTLHLAPNLRPGDQVKVTEGRSEVPSPNVYAFSIYIWQQINRWAKDGAKDYDTQAALFQHYLTPSCQQQLRNDRENRSKGGELSLRTRSLNEIPGQAYSSSRVIADGPNAWTVLLDMQVLETVRGVPVKDAYVRYPMRVVQYDVDREKNPFQLALDCFGGNRPERLDAAAVAGASDASAMAAAPLPATQASAAQAIAPNALPRDPANPDSRP